MIRKILLEKLESFLNGKISQDALYEWVLSRVCEESYEKTVQGDILFKETMQAILDINHDDVKLRPDRSDLEYCRRCLMGEEDFASIPERIKKRQEQAQPRSVLKDPAVQIKIFKMYRGYTVLFGISSLAVNMLVAIKPDLFKISAEAGVLKEAIGHIIYAMVILLPPERSARGKFFYPAVVILGLGFIYYWWMSFSISFKLAIHPLMAFVIAPFAGVPASLGVFLLLRAYRSSKRALLMKP
ncbi:MAG: hypothetical protein A2Z88_05120 [Omnitrophica WOR_2 bacterium GWA2_47_8]|nr:MAG: hypothetical protein A2Z88_05120 [Omnitrophica WOR_2 bacterium GWA2_47_8]